MFQKRRAFVVCLVASWSALAIACGGCGRKPNRIQPEPEPPIQARATAPRAAAEPTDKAEPQAKSEPAPKTPELVWSPPTETVQIGDIQVRIVKTTLGKVPLKDVVRKDARSKDVLLAVSLELTNTNSTKKVEYRTWTGRDLSFDREYATLKDNFGNGYKRINFGFGATPVGAVERSESVYPNKAVGDLLVYEVPLDAAVHLDLELPAKNYGSEGVIRFRIPVKSITRLE